MTKMTTLSSQSVIRPRTSRLPMKRAMVCLS
jgi:hypothetical protein